jgi:NADH-quinone oxidoreductase subunit J
MIAFFLAYFSCVVSAFYAVLSHNTLHALFGLISTCLSLAVILFLINVNFIGTLIIIVYMGAITMLMMFVFMMIGGTERIDIKHKKIKYILPIIFIFIVASVFCYYINHNINTHEFSDVSLSTIAMNLYTKFIVEFQIVALILFISMFGSVAIVLQYKTRSKLKDYASRQISVSKSDRITYHE